jgi:hypothetical protein
VNRQEIPVKTLNHGLDRAVSAGWDKLHLQNLSNWPARICETAHSESMTNNKRVRVVFYALAIVEMILLSAFYSWGRVAH